MNLLIPVYVVKFLGSCAIGGFSRIQLHGVNIIIIIIIIIIETRIKTFFFVFNGSSALEVSDQLHVSTALSSVKNSPVPRAGLDEMERCLDPTGTRTPIPRSSSLATEIPRLPTERSMFTND
jgi:hypothetical protein